MRPPKIVIFDGKEYTINQLAEHLGVHRNTLLYRWKHGLPTDNPRPQPLIYKGQEYMPTELSRILGIHPRTLVYRFRNGHTLDAPVRQRSKKWEDEHTSTSTKESPTQYKNWQTF